MTSQLAKLDAKICIMQSQATEYAKLDLRLRSLELNIARCGQCNYHNPDTEVD